MLASFVASFVLLAFAPTGSTQCYSHHDEASCNADAACTYATFCSSFDTKCEDVANPSRATCEAETSVRGVPCRWVDNIGMPGNCFTRDYPCSAGEIVDTTYCASLGSHCQVTRACQTFACRFDKSNPNSPCHYYPCSIWEYGNDDQKSKCCAYEQEWCKTNPSSTGCETVPSTDCQNLCGGTYCFNCDIPMTQSQCEAMTLGDDQCQFRQRCETRAVDPCTAFSEDEATCTARTGYDGQPCNYKRDNLEQYCYSSRDPCEIYDHDPTTCALKTNYQCYVRHQCADDGCPFSASQVNNPCNEPQCENAETSMTAKCCEVFNAYCDANNDPACASYGSVFGPICQGICGTCKSCRVLDESACAADSTCVASTKCFPKVVEDDCHSWTGDEDACTTKGCQIDTKTGICYDSSIGCNAITSASDCSSNSKCRVVPTCKNKNPDTPTAEPCPFDADLPTDSPCETCSGGYTVSQSCCPDIIAYCLAEDTDPHCTSALLQQCRNLLPCPFGTGASTPCGSQACGYKLATPSDLCCSTMTGYCADDPTRTGCNGNTFQKCTFNCDLTGQDTASACPCLRNVKLGFATELDTRCCAVMQKFCYTNRDARCLTGDIKPLMSVCKPNFALVRTSLIVSGVDESSFDLEAFIFACRRAYQLTGDATCVVNSIKKTTTRRRAAGDLEVDYAIQVEYYNFEKVDTVASEVDDSTIANTMVTDYNNEAPVEKQISSIDNSQAQASVSEPAASTSSSSDSINTSTLAGIIGGAVVVVAVAALVIYKSTHRALGTMARVDPLVIRNPTYDEKI
eukprot:m.177638 g.177638  ORF g.177638 m.177638 type:complete len:798 (-) comp10440_c0_seq1:392-2785(-)